MLPPALRALRRALSQANARASDAPPAGPSARRCAESLELARGAEAAALEGRFTPAEFWRLYGYAPNDAPRMRELAEHLAFGGSSSRGGR